MMILLEKKPSSHRARVCFCLSARAGLGLDRGGFLGGRCGGRRGVHFLFLVGGVSREEREKEVEERKERAKCLSFDKCSHLLHFKSFLLPLSLSRSISLGSAPSFPGGLAPQPPLLDTSQSPRRPLFRGVSCFFAVGTSQERESESSRLRASPPSSFLVGGCSSFRGPATSKSRARFSPWLLLPKALSTGE